MDVGFVKLTLDRLVEMGFKMNIQVETVIRLSL
jgi:hypothetical protein